MMTNGKNRPHTGWTADEDALLMSRAHEARCDGHSLRAVFETVARCTGRQPNSVRNYYYARIRSGGEGSEAHGPAFVPFTGAESEALLREVLSAQARDESVRACTRRLGSGDERQMLRYQNKYRALIKNEPALVRLVIERLRQEGIAAADPYAVRAQRSVGRPRKRALPAAGGDVLALLARVEGLNLPSLLDALGALAVSAGGCAHAQAEAEELHGLLDARAEEIAGLRDELREAHERYMRLLADFRKLMRINTDFLQKRRNENLPHYLSALEDGLQTLSFRLSE